MVPAETFEWGRYICSKNTIGAPVSCFKHVSKNWSWVGRDLSWLNHFTASSVLQAPMGKCWGDIEEGVRIEVVNTDSNLSTKVYWIAEIIKLAGKTTSPDCQRKFLYWTNPPKGQLCQNCLIFLHPFGFWFNYHFCKTLVGVADLVEMSMTVLSFQYGCITIQQMHAKSHVK